MAHDEEDDEYSLPSWSRTLCGYRERFVLPYRFKVPIYVNSFRLIQSPAGEMVDKQVQHVDAASRGIDASVPDLLGSLGEATFAAELELCQSAVASDTHAAEASSSCDGQATGCTVWDAGIVLGACLLQEGILNFCNGGSCLEIGSGTGIVGLAAAMTGTFKRVVLSDLGSVLALTRRNVQDNLRRIPPHTEVL
eukprot:3659285-Pleurochrysis_carterae.AAC.1